MIDPALGAEADRGITDRTLRQFAAAGAGVLGLVAARAAVSGTFGRAAAVAAGLAAVVAVAGLVRPRLLKPVFVLAVAITKPLGATISIALLAVVYYGMFVPLAIVFRLAGRDELKRRRPARQVSHWLPKATPTDLRSYFRQS